MSPRQANPRLRADLVEAAARLLAEEGPQALTTRRLASAVGASTTAVYTHFGGMEDLVRAMVHEGFARLDRRMGEVRASGDPVADIAALGLAYHGNALEHPHLYGVMFGGVGFGGFSLTEEDRQHGRYTLEPVARAVEAAMEAGRFQQSDPRLVAHQMWIALHGLVTLELGGFLIAPYDAQRCFAAQVHGLLVGAGDDPAAARRSLESIGTPVDGG